MIYLMIAMSLFVPNLFLPTQVKHLHPLLRLYADLPEDVPLEVYEEVKSEPTIRVDNLDPDQLLMGQPAQMEDGDILVFQIAVPLDEEEQYQFAHVREFLTYKVSRREVTFRKVTDPGEEGFKLELLKGMSYDLVGGLGSNGTDVEIGSGDYVEGWLQWGLL
jgi:hypothetical protein